MLSDLTPPHGLRLSGRCHGDNATTVLLLSPDEPLFWSVFTASPEYNDGLAHPMDRWSTRVITCWAEQHGGKAVFPSDGPPYPDFLGWARKSGQFWQSPVGMLVNRHMGLFVSFRGAVLIPGLLDLPAPDTPPCPQCPQQPCLSACPVHAFSARGYDVPKCHDWLDQPRGADCMNNGCGVRRACPLSKDCGRLTKQSAWHMRYFHP